MSNNAPQSAWPAPDDPADEPAFTLDERVVFMPLAQDGCLTWSWCRHPVCGREYILATAAGEEAEPQATLLLKNEFALRGHLTPDWAVIPVATALYHGRYALLYRPFPFETLTRITGTPAGDMAAFLDLALNLCAPLLQMHQHGLIHGDIKPGNLFINNDGSCRLGGFGLASGATGTGARTTVSAAGGTLAYMSPEHAARTRRAVDHRSDLYSLGIVLYELLTGSLPFDLTEGGQAEWVHHHIASEPRPPHQVRPGTPDILSSIILRLLAKSPENRYQTTEGLMADLRRCRATVSPSGSLTPFPLGLQDRAAALPLSDALFTGHPQSQALLEAFSGVNHRGTQALVVISGPSGIGKSSLIASALSALQHQPVLLAVSRVDQYQPALPYAVLTSAFRSLALHILGLPAAEIARWKARLSQTLGSYAGLAVNLVPELGLLLAQPSWIPPDTLSIDARARFNHMVLCLIKAFATPCCPLVLMIDDIHWVDAASLQLLEYVVSNSTTLPLLMVVAYRDDTHTHGGPPLAGLRAAAAKVTEIRPEPMTVKGVTRWLADAFQTRVAGIASLAALVHEKTGGNPLFVQQFVKRIVDDGLVTHHTPHKKWHYDLPAIRARHYTENVAGLVLQQLAQMPPDTRKLLGSLACLGNAGNLAVLTRVLRTGITEMCRVLHPAVAAQLITLSVNEYAFTHNRVQEAAFALLDPAEKSHLHLATASLLAEMSQQATGNDTLFRAVHHVASAIEAIEPLPQRRMFRELSLLAAQRAKRTGDSLSALGYLRTARALADKNAPDDHQLTFTLDLEEAECEFLLGNLATAARLCAQLAGRPGGLAEKAVAACLLAEIHMRQSHRQQALETAIAWLSVFGISLSRYPDARECDDAHEAIVARVGDDPAAVFKALPRMDDRDTEAVMNLLASAGIFASFCCPRLHFLILCRMLHLTLDHGMTGAGATALAWFGVLIGHRYETYQRGFRYGLLARELVSRHGYLNAEARILLPLDQLSVWTQPLSFTVECAKACFTAGVTHGDLTSACFATCHQVINFLTRGDHLDAVLTSIDRGLAFVRKAHFQDVETILLIQRHLVEHLRDPNAASPAGAGFLPDTLLPGTRDPMPTLMFWYWLYKALAHFAAGEFAQAADDLSTAGTLSWSAPGHIHLLDYHLFSILSLTQQLTPESITPAHRRWLQPHYRKLALWAQLNPGTFADKEALVYAEMARLDAHYSLAMKLYEKAIRLSREAAFDHINGLAHELAGRFVQARSYPTAADAHFRGAMAAWGRCGAQARVRQLERQYPHLVVPRHTSPYDTIAFAQNEEIRDLQSVINASRALSEEINLGRLIQILMTMLLERAGAQRGLLIRVAGNHLPEIEACADTTSGGVQVQIVKAVPGATDLPLSVLSAVIRTGQEIRTGKPGEFSPFSQDPYLVTSGAAVMCVPMFKQARLVGVLYLENRLMPEVFTAEHSKIIGILAAQAAVSLETARLYAELLEENIQRRRVEKELRASQTSLMLGEQISHTGTWRWDVQQDLMVISDEYGRILGLPPSQKSISMADFLTRVHVDDHPRISTLVTESVRDHVTMRAEFRIIREDGATRYLLGIGNPVQAGAEVNEYFGTITDITAHRQAEDAARVAQADLARVARATTVGQLTASIAHEINQPLMSIVSNAGASLRWLGRDPAQLGNARAGLEEIITEGQRAGEIIRSLQALTRNQPPSFARVDLHQIAHHIMMLSRSELERQRVAVEYQLQAEQPGIWSDSVQIQQVLLNLVANAIDAMADITDRPRLLTLSSSNPAPGYLRFCIADTGIGLDPAVMARVFDSFYTTKKQGMGMGLTISHAIIERHRGKLSAEARRPYGSCFTFVLPTEGEGK
ncbi:trifunctional serine/threonine-protein kinase/ATP-binding protein/sensor histidine kinase [Chimaeribacter arupi]|uniref:trifunctional serine/threonine-protein kinase/ATP-binding protein/sensor histidine kinase n=1 Tax=Chimaeribacter arupi TaxID=2060066 RepID=UPI000C7A4394|nr:AAA family ATPase [Chimaeribacter arupi]PLR42313.1 histidine kinase [Chimaeribacter arupi]